jgi:hypothetical protein
MTGVEQFIDYAQNSTGKLYLSKYNTSGSGTEIQVVMNDFGLDLGKKTREKKNYFSNNFAVLEKPSELGSLSLKFDSNKLSPEILALSMGALSTSGSYSYVEGDGTLSDYRLAYEIQTYNATTAKTEARRLTVKRLRGTKAAWSLGADKSWEVTIDGEFANANVKVENTLDISTSALPALGDYT